MWKATFQSCNCKFTITHTTIVIDLSYNDVKRRKNPIYATNRLIFYLGKKDEIYHYRPKEHPKIFSKVAKFGSAKSVVKYGKYSPVDLANFEYFSITRGKNKNQENHDYCKNFLWS
jgi:hypothetical protein